MPNLQTAIRFKLTSYDCIIIPWLLLGDLGVAEHLQSGVAVVVADHTTLVLGVEVAQWGDDAVALGLVCLAQHKDVVTTTEGVGEDADRPAVM